MGKTVDDFISLDIRELNHLGLRKDVQNHVQLTRGGEPVMSLLVELPDEWTLILRFDSRRSAMWRLVPIHQTVSIHGSESHFGLRRWFVCPFCERRCAILYSNPKLMCRRCLDLPYASQSRSRRTLPLPVKRAMAQRRKLGGSDLPWDSFPARPRGMASEVYERLRKADEEAVGPFLDAQLEKFERLLKTISKKHDPEI